MPSIPKSMFQFADRVRVQWHEAECPPVEATITGVNYDHRRDVLPHYTITEDNGQQTDGLDWRMLTRIG